MMPDDLAAVVPPRIGLGVGRWSSAPTNPAHRAMIAIRLVVGLFPRTLRPGSSNGPTRETRSAAIKGKIRKFMLPLYPFPSSPPSPIANLRAFDCFMAQCRSCHSRLTLASACNLARTVDPAAMPRTPRCPRESQKRLRDSKTRDEFPSCFATNVSF